MKNAIFYKGLFRAGTLRLLTQLKHADNPVLGVIDSNFNTALFTHKGVKLRRSSRLIWMKDLVAKWNLPSCVIWKKKRSCTIVFCWNKVRLEYPTFRSFIEGLHEIFDYVDQYSDLRDDIFNKRLRDKLIHLPDAVIIVPLDTKIFLSELGLTGDWVDYDYRLDRGEVSGIVDGQNRILFKSENVKAGDYKIAFMLKNGGLWGFCHDATIRICKAEDINRQYLVR